MDRGKKPKEIRFLQAPEQPPSQPQVERRKGTPLSFLVGVMVLVCYGTFTLTLPILKGEDYDSSLGCGTMLYGIVVIDLLRNRKKRSREAIKVALGILVIGFAIGGYILFHGLPLPRAARDALDHYIAEHGRSDYSLHFMRTIRETPLTVDDNEIETPLTCHAIKTYCVIIDPPLRDGRNTLIVDQLPSCEYIVIEKPLQADILACKHVLYEITNRGFEED